MFPISKNIKHRQKWSRRINWYKSKKLHEITSNKYFIYQKFTPYIIDAIIYSHDISTSMKHTVVVEFLNYIVDFLLFIIRYL